VVTRTKHKNIIHARNLSASLWTDSYYNNCSYMLVTCDVIELVIVMTVKVQMMNNLSEKLISL